MYKSTLFQISLFAAVVSGQAFASNEAPIADQAPSQVQQPAKTIQTATIETVKGRVVKIENVQRLGGKRQVVKLTLKTDKEEVIVRLGPQHLIDRLNLNLKNGDSIEVTGFKTTLKNHSVMLATEIKKDSQTWKLRDQNGRQIGGH